MKSMRPHRDASFWDKLNLFFPALLILLSILEIVILGRALQTADHREALRWMQDILFLNYLHIGMSLLFLWGSQSGRQAWNEFKKRGFLRGVGTLLFVFVGATWVSYEFTFGQSAAAQWPALIFTLGLFTLRRHHELGQSKGLLRVLNMRAPEFSKRTYDRERWWIRNLMLSQILLFAALIWPPFGFNYHVKAAAWVGILVCVAGLYRCTFQSADMIQGQKALFNLRFAVKSFLPFSAVASSAGGSIHGVEYLSVTGKLLHPSQQVKVRHYVISLLALGLFILLALMILRFPESFGIPDLRISTQIGLRELLLSTAAGLAITHYAFDHYFFTPAYAQATPLLSVLTSQDQTSLQTRQGQSHG
ncbi:MAG TPA: hypothetical protein PLZ57_06520 [Pseudobdellovibrionaceae bacterium]|nr:hypothetical protein [Pseudobdellovibrionaceae bacterium]